MNEHESITEARRFLHANLAGEFQFDEHLRPMKIVIGHDGRIVGPVMVAMMEAAQTVLFLPQATDDAMQLLITLEPFEEEGPAAAVCDRWRIYHGEPDDLYWAEFAIDAAKFHDAIIDGDALRHPNPFADTEAKFCKDVNQNHLDALREMCKARNGVNVEEPRLVGIDPFGLDIRARFGIVRIEFNRTLDSVDDIRAMLQQPAT